VTQIVRRISPSLRSLPTTQDRAGRLRAGQRRAKRANLAAPKQFRKNVRRSDGRTARSRVQEFDRLRPQFGLVSRRCFPGTAESFTARFRQLPGEVCSSARRTSPATGGELEWPLADARERSVHIAEEPVGEPRSLVLVPPRGILEIGLSEWPNDEPAAHSIQWLLLNFCGAVPEQRPRCRRHRDRLRDL
jgi:hypothetical protein